MHGGSRAPTRSHPLARHPPGDASLRHPAQFVETFDTTGNVDAAATNALVADGLVRGAITSLGDPGTGAAGGLVVQNDGDLPPGSYELASLEVLGDTTVAGDLTLRVSGAVRVAEDARLTVEGDLTVVLGGVLRVEGTARVLGSVWVEQPTDAGIEITGDVSANSYDDDEVASLSIDTRGPIRIVGGQLRGRGTATASVRTYGDVTLDEGFLESEEGDFRLDTEGDVTISNRSFLGAASEGGAAVVRGLADLQIIDSSFLRAGGGGGVDVVIHGALSVTQRSFLHCSNRSVAPCDVLVTAGSVRVEDASWIESPEAYDAPAGQVSIAAAGDVEVLDDGWIAAGDGYCMNGGSITIRSGGDVSTAAGTVRGGASWPSDTNPEGEACTDGRTQAQAAGIVLIEAAGAVVLGDTKNVGSLTIVEDGELEVVPDAGVRSVAVVTSLGLPLEVANGRVLTVRADHTADPAMPVRVEGSPDGTPEGFGELGSLVGDRLSSGWRYRAHLTTRMFDSPALDTIEVEYR